MPSVRKQKNGKWLARWRTPEGDSRCKTFDRKVDAERHATTMEAAKLQGSYVDPQAGKLTFGAYVQDWADRQTWKPATRERVEIGFRRHILPALGSRPIASIKRSEVQAFVKAISERLKPSTVEWHYRQVAAVFNAAVLDRLVAVSPCVKIALPRAARAKVKPLSVEQVQALAEAIPARYGALILLAAGSGLRVSEALGLTVDRVDFLRRTVTVDRQLVTPTHAQPYFDEPKTASSHRVVPVSQAVVDVLAAHLAAYGPGPDGLIFTNADGRPIRRNRFSTVYKTAAVEVGVEKGFHQLRHHYASVLIGAGCSVKAVQEALGHAKASETLDTYSHLWPADDDRLRAAVDAAWAGGQPVRDAAGL